MKLNEDRLQKRGLFLTVFNFRVLILHVPSS